MNRILSLIFIVFTLFSCNGGHQSNYVQSNEFSNVKSNYKPNDDSSKKENSDAPTDRLLTIDFNSLRISPLPYGYPNFFKAGLTNKNNIFFTNQNDGSPYEPFIDLQNGAVEKNNAVNSILKNNSSFYYQLNAGFVINNFRNHNTIQYKQYLGRLPDFNTYKILIFKNVNISYKTEGLTNDVENLLELAVFDALGNVISLVNIGNTITSNFEKETGIQNKRSYKVFWINNTGEVNVKYIETSGEETEGKMLYECQYRIMADGSVVQYFKQQNGLFKNPFETGEIKDHKKNGSWTESLNESEEAEIFYINGVPQTNDIDVYSKEKFQDSYKRIGLIHSIKNGKLIK